MTPRPVQWLGDDESKPAPEPLVRVQALVNTVELPDGPDRLADSADARPWLIDNAPVGTDRRPDLSPTWIWSGVCARRCVRCWCTTPAARRRAVRRCRRCRRSRREGTARADCGDAGEVRLSATGDTVRERLVELLLIMRDAQRDGSWARLKACANDECQWAFYDRSRNHGGTWCEMSACGNKLKNRDFRARGEGRT